MGQFKPMVKMMTSEPTVELKLKKGGAVKKADGGVMGLPSSMPSTMPAAPARGGLAPAMAPRKPSMAARRKAMMASPAPVSAMKTGGVAMGEGGYKKGGLTKSGVIAESTSAKGAEGFKKTKMHDGGKKDKAPAKTGDIKLNKAAGYKDGGAVNYVNGNVVGTPPGKTNTKTGEVKDANAGGYCKGGAAKKYARGGAVVQDDGKAEKMPQGHKKPPAPVSITALSGTYKKGGRVKKMADGGDVEDLSKGAYDRAMSDTPTGYGFAKKVHSAIDRFFGVKPKDGRPESTPSGPAKKRGGAVKKC